MAGSWRQISRAFYLASRFTGDMDAASRGRLVPRLARRSLRRRFGWWV